MKRARKLLIGSLIALGLIYLILIVIAYLPRATTPVEALAGKDSQFVEVKGLTIHYTRHGQGKPLILVHGFAGSIYTWRHLIPLLSDRYTVYALDVLGFGLSDKPGSVRTPFPATTPCSSRSFRTSWSGPSWIRSPSSMRA